MFAGYVSEPMPGEKGENLEAKEKAKIVGDDFSEAVFPAFSPDGQSDESAWYGSETQFHSSHKGWL